MSSMVLVDVHDSVAWLTLAAPPVNALSWALIDDLSEALIAHQPPKVRAVVIRAARGARVFSAGHDVRELPTNGRDPLTYNDPLRKVVRQIETHQAPVIAMVEGSVWGGACELVLACDLVVAAAGSTFALTPARLGVPYNLAGMLNLMKSPLVHRIIKEELRVLANAHPLTPEGCERIQSLRREVYDSEDYQEGIRAFLEKRTPDFHGT